MGFWLPLHRRDGHHGHGSLGRRRHRHHNAVSDNVWTSRNGLCRFWPLCRGLHLFDLDRPRRPRRPWWPHERFRTSEPFQVRNGLCIFQVHFHIFSIRTQLDSKTWSEFSTIPQWPLCHNHKPTKVEPNLSSGAQLLLWSQIKLFFHKLSFWRHDWLKNTKLALLEIFTT